MNGWLLDTNVLSELRKPKPERKVLDFIKSRSTETLFVSDVSLAELRYGIYIVTDPVRRSDLADWLANDIRPMFEGRTLPVSEDIVVRWRLMVEEGRRRRITYAQPDLFIAATALHHGLTVVSRDAAEFERAGAEIHNPWA